MSIFFFPTGVRRRESRGVYASLRRIPSLEQIALICLIRLRDGCLMEGVELVAGFREPVGASDIHMISFVPGSLLSRVFSPELSRQTVEFVVMSEYVLATPSGDRE